MIRTGNAFCIVSAMLVTVMLATLASGAAVGLQRIASGLNRPVYVTHAPGDEECLFIVEKTGVIKILDLADRPLIRRRFSPCPIPIAQSNEEGLLRSGLSIPSYATNGKFYINVTVDDDGGEFLPREPTSASTRFRPIQTWPILSPRKSSPTTNPKPTTTGAGSASVPTTK